MHIRSATTLVVEDRDTSEGAVPGELGRAVPITTRRMFGCVGVYSGGAFFAIVDGGRLYFKVDADNRPAYAARGTSPFSPGGRRISSFYGVPPSVIDDGDVLRVWAKAAIAAANREKGK